MKITKYFVIQQQKAADEHYKLTSRLLATGKVIVSSLPDYFIWTGTKAQFLSEIKKGKK